MKFRRRFLPHTISDAAATGFLFVILPITFWFEISIVLPQFYSIGSFSYTLNLIVGVFFMFNINANLLSLMICDTSIKGELLNPPENETEKRFWRLCVVCETLAPPRSWHCNICGTCILKRDHHCVFTGNCIGHRNHRYFIMLIFFIFIGSTYASIYNNIFIWFLNADTYANWSTILKMVFPLFMIIFDVSNHNYYLTIYEINLLGAAFSLVLLIYHSRIILKGAVVHDRTLSTYNLGWKKNVKMVLGERWYLTWISPFVESPLPHNGINWETVLSESVKNR